MFFFPYRVDLDLHRFPILTFSICLLCFFVYIEQASSLTKYSNSINEYCSEPPTERTTLIVLRNITGMLEGYPCEDLYLDIREADDPDVRIRELVETAKPLNLFANQEDELAYMEKIVASEFNKFDRAIPHDLTDELVYDPNDIRLWTMITSSFSHGGLLHLGGNLLFFIAFASAIEVIVGHIAFISIITISAITTGLAYSYSVSNTPDLALPTLGLSGIVSTMIALLAVLSPKIRIRCFLWFFVFFKILRLPALVLAAWFIGWDIYYLKNLGPDSEINFVSHVSGAITGALIGVGYWIFRGKYIRSLN